MARVLVLDSSYRKNGNSALALRFFQRCLEEKGASVEYLRLAESGVGQCRGCRLCFDRGEAACPLSDGLLPLYEKLAHCDLLILGGPIYVEDINGAMKNWIDRMAFNCHRPGLYGQKAFILLNSGSGASRHAFATLARACQTWGMRVMGERKFVMGARIEEAAFIEANGSILRRDAESILRKLAEPRDPTFIQVLTFRIQRWYYLHRMDPTSYDHHHWNSQHWLEKDRYYYSSEPVGAFKRVLADLFGWVIIRLVLR